MSLAFFILVIGLLVYQGLRVQWGEVFARVRQHPGHGLAVAAALAGISHLLFSCFDLLGRRYVGHTLPAARVMLITFIGYAFTLSMGSLIGGLGLRLKLYSRLGLPAGLITRVFLFTGLTNWLGYLLLFGVAYQLAPLALPETFRISAGLLHIISLILLVIVVAYLAACAFSRRREWTVRGQSITLPSWQLAVLQILMGAANWLLMAGIVYVLLQQHIAFVTVLSVLLLCAIAGVLTHVPGNLGVLEAIFVALLSNQVPRNELLAALIVYRAIYYLVPLLVATLAYLLFEWRVRNLPSALHS